MILGQALNRESQFKTCPLLLPERSPWPHRHRYGKTSGHGRDPTVVAEGIVSALKAGEFHLFPDTMARDFGGAYQSYAENIIEPLPEQA